MAGISGSRWVSGVSDEWPAIRVKIFDGESVTAYARRSARIVAIMNGFRHGRYRDPVEADRLERELATLQDPAIAIRSVA